MRWNVTNLEEFAAATSELLSHISKLYTEDSQRACVVCLHGNLGAGKTTMSQIIGTILGVSDNMQSPTFVIKKTYMTTSPVFRKLIHMDAYRLEDRSGIEMLGLEGDFTTPNTLMLIEWPEMISDMISVDAIHMFIEHVGEERVILMEHKKTTD